MIKRKLYKELKSHLSEKEIILLTGPRQAGKTTLLRLLKEDLEKKGQKTLMFNLDIETDKQFFTSQSYLIKKIELEFGKDKGFVFIDEIQRKEDAGVFLKGIYDMDLPYKFIVSGSGSLELKEKVHESLMGRKKIFELSTITFEEFVDFKTGYKYEQNLNQFFEIEKTQTENLLKEYMAFGGYPKMILKATFHEKEEVISEIYQSYIEKDIAYLLKIKKTDDFSNLVKLMASQVGNIVNISEISRTLSISQQTVQNYLWYLQKTFIFQKITPYFSNIRKEITKAPIFYFYDLGLRNFALGRFGKIDNISDCGFLFQNFSYNLLKSTFKEIHFWRTRNGAEVDFIIDEEGNKAPFEIKYQNMKKPEIGRSFRSFLEKYQPKKGIIMNLSLNAKININNTKVHFYPFYKVLKNNFQE